MMNIPEVVRLGFIPLFVSAYIRLCIICKFLSFLCRSPKRAQKSRLFVHIFKICTFFLIFSTYPESMSQKIPNNKSLHPLPPSTEQVETIAIFQQMARAAGALGELKGIARTIPNQRMLINAIVLREAKDSSAIENIITTQDELYRAMSVQQMNNPNTKEVINYRQAIFTGFELIKKQGFLRLRDLETLQGTIVENAAGLRRKPGTVLRNDRTGEVVYIPPQDQQEILESLSNFLEHFNLNPTQRNPLLELAILHYQFESIHPFYDGNGRTGRILNILYLIRNGLIDIPILYLSAYITEHKVDYYRLLNGVNENGAWEEWIVYMLKAVETTAQRTIRQIERIRKSLQSMIEEVSNSLPKIYRKELVELLFEQPYVKISHVEEKLEVERKAASRYLQQLEKINVLTSEKVGRQRLYLNHRLLAILRDEK